MLCYVTRHQNEKEPRINRTLARKTIICGNFKARMNYVFLWQLPPLATNEMEVFINISGSLHLAGERASIVANLTTLRAS